MNSAKWGEASAVFGAKRLRRSGDAVADVAYAGWARAASVRVVRLHALSARAIRTRYPHALSARAIRTRYPHALSARAIRTRHPHAPSALLLLTIIINKRILAECVSRSSPCPPSPWPPR
ncbi:hypothetical protein GCM10027056_14440 [Glaciibacter psychrotolerans]